MPAGTSNPSTLIVGAYGKVPTHGDFIRLRLDSALTAPIDRWFAQGARAILGRDDTAGFSAFDVVNPVCCVFPVQYPDRLAAAVLLPSQDKVGRRFPFALVTSIPAAGAGGDRTGLWSAMFISFFDRVLAQNRKGWGEDPAAISSRLDALAVTIDPRALESQAMHDLDHADGDDLWTRLFGEAPDLRTIRRERALATIRELPLPPPGGSVGLHFVPLTGQADVVFWPLLCWLLHGRLRTPSLVAMQVAGDDSPPGMTVLWGQDGDTGAFAALWPGCGALIANIFEVMDKNPMATPPLDHSSVQEGLTLLGTLQACSSDKTGSDRR